MHQILEGQTQPGLNGVRRGPARFVVSERFENDELDIKIDGVPLVPRALFKIDAVVEYLPAYLVIEYILAQFSPVSRTLKKRQLSSEVIQAKGFAGEVRIGAVISRQILLYMPPMKIKEF